MKRTLTKNEMSHELVRRLNLRTKGPLRVNSKSIQLFCPFHEEKQPSMFINAEKGIYHCFSCRRSGTINNLAKELTGNTIYKLLDLQYDEFSDFALTQKQPIVSFSETPQVYIKESDNGLTRASGLSKDKKTFSFLRRRGISLKTAESMKMFSIETLVRYNGTAFKNRIGIPIYEGTKLLSIEGRALDINTQPKVLYPKGSSVSTLYDLEHLDKSQKLYIVEGLMDLAFLRQDPFFKNSTCIFGANINPRQLYLLDQFSEVIYLKENDNGGTNCVQDLMKLKTNKGILKLPTIINYQKIKDVGDFPLAGYTVERYRKETNWITVGYRKIFSSV